MCKSALRPSRRRRSFYLRAYGRAFEPVQGERLLSKGGLLHCFQLNEESK